MSNSYDNSKSPAIGDIYLMQFSGTGSEQRGWRPGLIFQNNTGNMYSPNVIVLPLTSSIKKINQPTHVFIPADGTGLLKDSLVLCENPERMSKEKLGSYLTTLPDKYMIKVTEAYILATSAISFLSLEELYNLWHRAIKLNSRESVA